MLYLKVNLGLKTGLKPCKPSRELHFEENVLPISVRFRSGSARLARFRTKLRIHQTAARGLWGGDKFFELTVARSVSFRVGDGPLNHVNHAVNCTSERMCLRICLEVQSGSSEAARSLSLAAFGGWKWAVKPCESSREVSSKSMCCQDRR